jgi:hypothetical protein
VVADSYPKKKRMSETTAVRDGSHEPTRAIDAGEGFHVAYIV